ncbi:hypothetical protein AC579_4643 [Pseudocercospora musae]|uniref:F-box domain-containing protein n=1 Tax=Pseudocercospora musae TaxID=113226 RepID=A0A139IBK2_9PEZI|nr:hypothetical protein AC579_4643 [Pseudocercospora musae]
MDMASRLELLPTELLDHILEAVDDTAARSIATRYHDRIRVFDALSRTCRLFRNAGRPYLYRTFESLNNGKGLRTFARTLYEEPTLVPYVHLLNVIPSRAACAVQPSHEDLRRCMRVLRSLKDTSIYNDIVDALLQGCHTAELVVLLCLTTNMRILQISTYDHQTAKDHKHCWHCPDMAECLQAVFSPTRLSTFPTVPYSTLDYCFLFGKFFDFASDTIQHRGTSPSSIQTLLQLPGLTALDCSGIGAAETNMQWTAPATSSNVERLKLVYGNVDADSVHKILRTCKCVKDLEIAWEAIMPGQENHEDHNMYVHVETSILKAALDLHKEHLEELELTNKMDECMAWASQPRIGDFHDFTSLRKLRIDESLLRTRWREMDFELLLPRSLVALVIYSERNLKHLSKIIPALRGFKGEDWSLLQVLFPSRREMAGDIDEVLARPRSEKALDWNIGLRDSDDGKRIGFQCEQTPVWRCLERLTPLLCTKGVVGMLEELFPEAARSSDAEEDLANVTRGSSFTIDI